MEFKENDNMLENILPGEPIVPGAFMKALSLRLDQQTRDDLTYYARNDGFTVSTLIRHLIMRYLQERRKLVG
jgi:hypothetical protein